ncbi:DEAD-box ATP-dependent RNA helicase 42 [Senna tora]|uniref:DEAD-box ATP-dependent RNA helicase 42 n=1 Tax=Senna tora TaxID=362788 RepID=A0A834TII2_9FABA|nr:DEAD-box ATP-dependent RNA helicase 42 [Senna tora]
MSSEKDKEEVPMKRNSRRERENSDIDSEYERKHSNNSRRKGRESSGSEGEHERKHRKSDSRKRKSRRHYSSDEDSDFSSSSEDDESEYSGSDSEYSDSDSESLVTDSWGKYGIIRETDMWNKRPEFTAWLAEVKQVNLESLANWEEKQMFKEFMEDHNTATFPSKKYYNLDAYHRHQIEKEMKRGFKKVMTKERTVFNDEEQRRQELQQAREKHKEEQVLALKRSMESGMAQAMKEQAQLREEMAYQYKLGNFEAAAAIQRRLDPDAAI